ncbi:tRNA pseudouridine(38-40) synthase TruA [Coxiella endosymbiont of Ornithodoros amblus]|uniref:tRNA pseudouridine(38-40) synthase TruA n=1 Tax=Coxiella endosymbiont of Ornithodoros amblus TaxID=1656166 RepID=UPI00244E2AAF|nr:tRNA pseudouridine(38-40) synthase TruA [Coxiella endosymbiont of Ornithodoros amblus]MBW5802430.1 tRNA pseudouridine(38-40) synthase TruA [Coxiella endosymbiont of Ornithodoros amblus]
MARIALGIRYDGSAYHGWQVQEALKTVQGKVEKALSAVANHPVFVTCAGRTDAGVHATAQVVHFDTTAYRSDHAWVFGANSNLPHDISVLWAKEVDEDFHARYSAIARRYRYIIYNHEIRPAILRKAIGWHYYRSLDEKRMQAGAQYLIGEHDFSSFQGAGCQSRTPMRKILQIEIYRIRRMVVIEVQANAFLLHMVRNIAGVLMAIGSGEKHPDWARTVLKAKDRQLGGVTVPPNGLYLVEVDYPSHFKLPRTPLGPFFYPNLLSF